MKQSINIRVGKNIRKVRENHGLSQEALSDSAGVHRTYIGMVERAERNITLVSLEKISKALKISMKDLL